MILKTALDIGSKFIKVGEGYEKKGKLYIRKLSKIENPIENFRRSTEEEIATLGNFIKDYLHKNDFISKNLICSIGNLDVVYHYFEIPNLSDEETEKAIKLEATQIISDFMENYEYDYFTFTQGNKKNITFIGCPLNKVNLYTNISSKIRSKPLILDVDSSAILNSFLFFNKNVNLLCMLNIGHSISNLGIYSKNKFLFLRDIPWGKKEIENISDNLSSDEKISEFIENVNISLKYFQNKTNDKIVKIYLTGGGILPEIKEFIEKNIGISCELYNPLLNLENIPLEIKKDGFSFAIIIGLLTRRII